MKQRVVEVVKDDVITYLATLGGPLVFAISGTRLPSESRETSKMGSD